jgi:hypothetical protein
MSFKICNVENYLSTLENNINNLKNTKDPKTFHENINKMEEIILLLRKIYPHGKNLFDKYIKKEIFSNILSFLPKNYILSKKSICKNWYELLTCDFTRKALNLLNKPYCIRHYYSFRENFRTIAKLNNRLCCTNYYNESISLMTDKGKSDSIYRITKDINKIIGNKYFLIWYKKNKITIDNSERQKKNYNVDQ